MTFNILNDSINIKIEQPIRGSKRDWEIIGLTIAESHIWKYNEVKREKLEAHRWFIVTFLHVFPTFITHKNDFICDDYYVSRSSFRSVSAYTLFTTFTIYGYFFFNTDDCGYNTHLFIYTYTATPVYIRIGVKLYIICDFYAANRWIRCHIKCIKLLLHRYAQKNSTAAFRRWTLGDWLLLFVSDLF